MKFNLGKLGKRGDFAKPLAREESGLTCLAGLGFNILNFDQFKILFYQGQPY